MRHRQTSGAGPSGARPVIIVLSLTVAAGLLAVTVARPHGDWPAYGTATVAALFGAAALWRQRLVHERRIRQAVRDRRADQDAANGARNASREEITRLRLEVEHEQQYTTMIQEQLTRARLQLEEERRARLAAEREADKLSRWRAVAQPAVAAAAEAVTSLRGSLGEPAVAQERRPPLAAVPVAEPRGAEPGDALDRAERMYRPFIDRLAAPVSEAALAMAPVIGPRSGDEVLDLTAYDETQEFSVRERRRGLA